MEGRKHKKVLYLVGWLKEGWIHENVQKLVFKGGGRVKKKIINDKFKR